MSDFQEQLSSLQHTIERAMDNMQDSQGRQNEIVNKKLDELIVQTTRTNGRVSVHAMVIYPLGALFLLVVGALLSNGVIPISLFK